MDWLIRQSLGIIAALLVGVAVHELLEMGDTCIVERGVVDPSQTVPVLVELGGGRIGYAEVPRFTQDKPHDGGAIIDFLAFVAGAITWLVVSGG